MKNLSWILSGALTLIVIDRLVAPSTNAAGKVGGVFASLTAMAKSFMDPKVPMFADRGSYSGVVGNLGPLATPTPPAAVEPKTYPNPTQTQGAI